MRKPITKRDRQVGPYPYYGATGVLDFVDGFLFDEPLVLVGEDGAKWGAGDQTAFRIQGKTWVNNHAHVIRPYRDALDDNWLVYYLNFCDLSEYISGMTVPKLNQGRMREISIPLPPLEEQKRIVAILDEAFDGLTCARENVGANLQSAEQLFRASLTKQFSDVPSDWERCLVESSFIRTKVPAKVQRRSYLGEGLFPIVSQEAELISGFWNEKADVVEAHRPLIVFGDHTRHLKYVDFDFVVGADGTQIMAPIMEIDPKFYFYALKAIPLEGKGYARHFSHLKKCTISYPKKLDDQRRIAERLDEISANVAELSNSYAKSVEDIGVLRQSLLHKAFSGQLT